MELELLKDTVTQLSPNELKETAELTYEGDLDVPLLEPAQIGKDVLMSSLRTMIIARQLDNKMLNLIKQGKGFFHIGNSGHEAAQVGIAMNAKPGYDWTHPYYRDMAYCLTLGLQPKDVLLAHFAKAGDPNSGGRQMPEHFSSKELKIMLACSAVGAQFLPAVGAGMGIKRQGLDSFVYVSGGEGSTSQGSFAESLNWAAKDQLPVLFHVQDNHYAISVHRDEQTAGGSIYKGLPRYDSMATCHVDGTDFLQMASVSKVVIKRLRKGEGPVVIVSEVVRLLPHSSSDSHAKYRSEADLLAMRQLDPITRLEMRLIDAGMTNVEELDSIRLEVKDQVNNIASWVESQEDPSPSSLSKHVYFEGDLGLEYESSEPSGEPAVMVDAINHALHEEMKRNPNILVYGEDVAGEKGGVFTATRGLTKEFGKERCFNSPLAENSVVGTAVGLSITGYKPVIEIQFGDYIWPAMQQLRNVVSNYRYRANNDWACPMVIRVPIGGYIHGGPYHSQNIEAMFGHTPGFVIVMPATAADAKGLLKTAIRSEDPVLFLEHKWLYRQPVARSPEPNEDYLVPFGVAKLVQRGEEISIITYGAMVHKCVEASRELTKAGYSVEIIDLRSLVPLDMDTVLASVRKTGKVLIVHEDQEFLGLGGEIAAQISEHGFSSLDAPIKRVAAKYTPVPFAANLEYAALPDVKDIIESAQRVLKY